MNMPFGSIAWIVFLSLTIFACTIGILLGLSVLRLIYPKSHNPADLSQRLPIAQYAPESKTTNEFVLNADDVIALGLYDYEHSARSGHRRVMRRIFLGAQGILFVLGIILLLISNKDQFLFVSGVVIIALSLLSLLWYLLSPVIFRSVIKRKGLKAYSNENKTIVKNTISIADEGLTHTTNIHSWQIPWKELAYVVSTDKYIYFYERSTSNVHILPLAAFPDAIAFEQFASTARIYLARSLSQNITK
jgi:hypothetical protein